MSVTIRLRSNNNTVTGFRYLWLKNVVGFDPNQHCAKFLVGPYSDSFGLRMPVNTDISIDCRTGDFLYFCGVASPYKWQNNAHLAGVVKKSATASLVLHTGDILEVKGMRSLAITDTDARSIYPNKSAAFLTCRNFQFGASYFG